MTMCCFSVCPYCRKQDHTERFTECDHQDHITEYAGAQYTTPRLT